MPAPSTLRSMSGPSDRVRSAQIATVSLMPVSSTLMTVISGATAGSLPVIRVARMARTSVRSGSLERSVVVGIPLNDAG